MVWVGLVSQGPVSEAHARGPYVAHAPLLPVFVCVDVPRPVFSPGGVYMKRTEWERPKASKMIRARMAVKGSFYGLLAVVSNDRKRSPKVWLCSTAAPSVSTGRVSQHYR